MTFHVFTSPPEEQQQYIRGVGDALMALPALKALAEKTGQRVLFHLNTGQYPWVRLFWKDSVQEPKYLLPPPENLPAEDKIIVTGSLNNNTTEDLKAWSLGMTRREYVAQRWGVTLSVEPMKPLFTNATELMSGFDCSFKWNKRQPLIMICPIANVTNRTWPLQQYAQVAQALQRAGYRVVVVGCETKRQEHFKALGVYCIPQTEPSIVVSLMQTARLVIGNDSGMTQLATITGIPAVAICGPTVGSVVYGDRPTTRVVQSYELECTGCMFLGRRGWRPLCDFSCAALDQLPASLVLTAVINMLSVEARQNQGDLQNKRRTTMTPLETFGQRCVKERLLPIVLQAKRAIDDVTQQVGGPSVVASVVDAALMDQANAALVNLIAACKPSAPTVPSLPPSALPVSPATLSAGN